MTETATKEPVEEPVDEEAVDTEVGSVTSSWEFVDAPPTVDEVAQRLKEYSAPYGLDYSQFIDYVQPLPQSKNVSLDKGQKDYRNVWTLYFTVAGRIAMINWAAWSNDWTVNYIPEPVTPTGVPGFLEFTDRMVYREYVEIMTETGTLGKRPGMAWVPRDGGSGAVKSNPYEKVETSARGRALAAWGIGILPGSGVASLDEMLSIPQMRATQASRVAVDQARRAQKPRAELESELRSSLEEWRQITAVDDNVIAERAQTYAKRTFNKELLVVDSVLSFDPLKDGELVLMLRSIKVGVAKARAEHEGLV